MPAKGPARMCPTSRTRIPFRGPATPEDVGAVTGRSQLRAQRREELLGTPARLDALVALLAERHDAHAEIGGTRVAEALEPLDDRRLVTGREHVALVDGV